MAVLDWIFLVLLLGSLLLGAWRGLVYELLTVLSWIAAFFAAQWFAPEAGGLLSMSGASEAVRYAAGFMVVFLLVVFAVSLVAWLAKKLLDSVGLRPADRTLGSVFGILRGLVFLMAATVVIEMTPLKTSPWWRESIGAGITSAALRGLKPLLPQEFGKYLP